MKIRYLLPLLAISLAQPAAAAQIRANYKNAHSAFAPAYSRTLPPIGFVNFCARHGEDCRPLGGHVKKARLTAARLDLLRQVNRYVNRKITPMTDQQLYNQPEVWEYPVNAGDCEDYVLLKKRYLEGLGFPSETLLITVVLDENGAGHAVLMARTSKGDLVLDNRRDRILPWYRTGYTFLKRQSQSDPGKWVSLTRGKKVRARVYGQN
jgi:predicted transglutaminase-like cysteine proteinase